MLGGTMHLYHVCVDDLPTSTIPSVNQCKKNSNCTHDASTGKVSQQIQRKSWLVRGTRK